MHPFSFFQRETWGKIFLDSPSNYQSWMPSNQRWGSPISKWDEENYQNKSPRVSILRSSHDNDLTAVLSHSLKLGLPNSSKLVGCTHTHECMRPCVCKRPKAKPPNTSF